MYFFYGLRFSNISVFLAKNNFRISSFQKINEFSELEEITESMLEVFSNFKKVNFFLKDPVVTNSNKRYFALLEAFRPKIYMEEDIFFPKNIKLINNNSKLFTLSSFKLKIRVVLEGNF